MTYQLSLGLIIPSPSYHFALRNTLFRVVFLASYSSSLTVPAIIRVVLKVLNIFNKLKAAVSTSVRRDLYRTIDNSLTIIGLFILAAKVNRTVDTRFLKLGKEQKLKNAVFELGAINKGEQSMASISPITHTSSVLTEAAATPGGGWLATALNVIGASLLLGLALRQISRIYFPTAPKENSKRVWKNYVKGSAAETYQNILKENENGNIQSQSQIPEALHNDRWLRSYNCAIGLTPARHPVMDPNGRTVYDRANIHQWLENSETSPVTRRPLQARQLKPNWAAQVIVNSRLAFHQQRMEHFRKQYGD